jgi:hypothetical protein
MRPGTPRDSERHSKLDCRYRDEVDLRIERGAPDQLKVWRERAVRRRCNIPIGVRSALIPLSAPGKDIIERLCPYSRSCDFAPDTERAHVCESCDGHIVRECRRDSAAPRPRSSSGGDVPRAPREPAVAGPELCLGDARSWSIALFSLSLTALHSALATALDRTSTMLSRINSRQQFCEGKVRRKHGGVEVRRRTMRREQSMGQ